MSRLTAFRSTASAMRSQKALLALAGFLFAITLTACQAALADDSYDAAGNDRTAAEANTRLQAGLTSQAADIDLDTVYEWAGVIEWSDLEGGHFVINRGCDAWALAPESEEFYSKLKELHGGRAVVWGTVSDASVYGRRTVNVTAVFGPNDPRPAIAMPQVPCPDDPVPSDAMTLNESEITLHGDLVWRSGGLWLVTDRGPVSLKLPSYDMVPELEERSADSGAGASFSLGEYGVAGMWALVNTGLVVEVRDIREWPFRNVAYDSCGDDLHVFGVPGNQLAANGWLIRDGGQWLLRTNSGVIFVHHGANTTDAALSSQLLPPDADANATDVASAAHRVVVIGEWKTDGTELHMEAQRFIRIKTVCDDPQPPRQPILPGEIAALGTLAFEDGRPYLDTPSGRIVLLTVTDANTEPQPAPGDALDEFVPSAGDDTEATTADGDDVARPVRYILVVGKWQVSASGQLAIVVRYALPWPYPYVTEVDPAILPEFGIMPVPPVQGGPVEPSTPPVKVMPDGTIAIDPNVEVEGDRPEPEQKEPATERSASNVSVQAALK